MKKKKIIRLILNILGAILLIVAGGGCYSFFFQSKDESKVNQFVPNMKIGQRIAETEEKGNQISFLNIPRSTRPMHVKESYNEESAPNVQFEVGIWRGNKYYDAKSSKYLIAHNDKAFSSLKNVQIGESIQMYTKEGTKVPYIVTDILSVKDDWEGTNRLRLEELIISYDDTDTVFLQTCINDDWNLLVIAMNEKNVQKDWQKVKALHELLNK